MEALLTVCEPFSESQLSSEHFFSRRARRPQSVAPVQGFFGSINETQ
jgi:hypothetical protein